MKRTLASTASRRPLRLGLPWGLALLCLAHALPAHGEVTAADRDLLGRADVSRAAPEQFRAEVRVGRIGRTKTVPLEIWRRGDDVLVRFLEDKERGKFLVKKEGELYFLSPGARNAVRLDSKFRLGGQASLDEILGLAYSEDYEIVGVERRGEGEATQVTFRLEAKEAGLPYPEVRYVLRESTEEPIRAEHVLASGKVAKILEFSAWSDDARLRPERMVVKDPIRGGAPVTVEFVEVEEVEAPEEIFDLEHGREARERLNAS